MLLKKLKIQLLNELAIPFLDIHPEKNMAQKRYMYPNVDTCTPMFPATLFTVRKTLKQPKFPWTEEGIKKMWYTCTMDYSPTIKKNGIQPFVAT